MRNLEQLASGAEQRSAVRFDAALPVQLEGVSGRTHNISASGVCFVSEVKPEVGALLSFTVEFTQGGQRHTLQCEGKVVRVESQDEGHEVAARLVTPLFAEPQVVELGRP